MALSGGLTVCVKDENDQAIRTYVRTHLGREISESSKAQQLKTDMAKKASGVYQLGFLVVREVLILHKAERNVNLI